MDGIDIATPQGDFYLGPEIRSAFGDFVIIKAGGSNDGRYVTKYADVQTANAKKNGWLVGKYWFNGGNDPAGDADYFLDNANWTLGEQIFLDIETERKADGSVNVYRWSPAQALAFVQRIYDRVGVITHIYMSNSVTSEANWQPLVDFGCQLWDASYTTNAPRPKYWPTYAIWQWSDSNGKLDRNKAQKDVWYSMTQIINNFSRPVILDDNRDPELSWVHHIARGSAGGVDLAYPKNTPVLANADGVVNLIPDYGNGGNTIQLRLADGRWIEYMHLNSFSVPQGKTVKAGEVIGLSGATGGNYDPHLHVHIYVNGKRENLFHYFTSGSGASTGTAGGGTATPIGDDELPSTNQVWDEPQRSLNGNAPSVVLKDTRSIVGAIANSVQPNIIWDTPENSLEGNAPSVVLLAILKRLESLEAKLSAK